MVSVHFIQLYIILSLTIYFENLGEERMTFI